MRPRTTTRTTIRRTPFATRCTRPVAAGRRGCRPSGAAASDGTRSSLANRHPRKLALADLKHDLLAFDEQARFVDHFFAVQLNPSLLQQAQRLRGARSQARLLEHLRDSDTAAVRVNAYLSHVFRHAPLTETRLE